MLPQSLVTPAFTNEELQKARLKWAQHMYQNLKSCSCAMCCNARRSPYNKGKHKLTRQEVKAELHLAEALAEL
jgi:hypothetical protein